MHDDLEIEDLDEEELIDEPHLKLNDIYPPYEKTDVDVSGIFLLSKLQLSHLHSEKSTQDLQTHLKVKLNFSLHPKIKILKLKKPILDLKKQQKKSDIILKNYHPPKTPYTLDVLDLENISRQVGPYGDIYKPKYDFKYRVLFFGRKIQRNSIKFFSQKNNLVYVGTFLFFIMSLFLYKSFITFKLENTLQNVKNIEFSSDTNALKNQISDLKYDFFTLNLALQPVFFLNSVIGNTDIQNLENIISGGNAILSSAMDGIFLYDSLSYNIAQKGWDKVYFGDFFRNSLPTLSSITQDFSHGVQELKNVHFAADDPLKNTFDTNIAKLEKLNTSLNTFVSQYDVFESLLGNEKKKKYMIVFQNDDEIRPTGGFMGSVMFVEIYRGKLEAFEKKDIYALEWPLKPFKQIAPEGIHKVTPTYGLRDANYYLEVGKSSQEIQKFLKKSKVEIDGILYINQNVITDVLAQTQGVYFEPLKTNVTSENFSWMFSTLVESKVFKEGTLGTPKQILFDFVPVFFTHIKEHSQKAVVAKSIVSSLEKRDILFWSFDEKQNTYLNNLAIFPQEPNYEKYFDYAYPYFTSISGNKSDRYIKRKFTKSYSLDQNCTVNTKLTLSSQHIFGVNDEINIKNFLYDMDLLGKVELAKTLFIQGKGENRQYVRMYLPKNAIIKESENYKIKQLKDRKEVSFYLNTLLNTTREMSINYQLPNPECQKYSFQFFKQPGLGSYDIEIMKDSQLIEQKQQEYDYLYQEY